MKKKLFHICVLSALLILPASFAQQGIPLRGQDYMRDAANLSKALGSAHAIRVRCNGNQDQFWRRYMQDFIELEAPQRGALRSNLVRGFNDSFSHVQSQYANCDQVAVKAEARFADEGRVLADRLASHYFPRRGR